jgi:hypothetical protein
MNKLTLLALCAASSLSAQGVLHSPKDLAAVEGQYYSYLLGGWTSMRLQSLDGENRGSIASMKEIAFRLDNRSYYSSVGMGRTFSNVTLQLADGDIATMTNNYAGNMKSTPTTVFSASVTWPTMTGYPLTNPALWGGTTGAYRFPFTTQWLYLGKTDIVTDWTFTGGTLANNYAWTSTLSRYYYFDGFGNPNSTVGGTYVSIPTSRLDNTSPGVTGRCNDSAFGTTSIGAYSYIYATIYPQYYANVDWQNKLLIYSYSYYTAYNAPVIHAWGFQTNTTGINLGTGCNNMHALGPYVMQTFIVPPKTVNTSAYSGYRYNLVPWNNALANLKICMQGAWSDSVTGKLALSQAREVTLPASGPPTTVPERSGMYSYATNGPYGPYSTYPYNPPYRWTY